MQLLGYSEPGGVARSALIDALAPAVAALVTWKLSPGMAPKGWSAQFVGVRFHGGDSRLWVGPLVVLVIWIQALVQVSALCSQLLQDSAEFIPGLSAAVILLEWIIAAVSSSYQLLSYLQSIRHKHFGLFSHTLYAFLSASLCANLAQTYYTFFAREILTTPSSGAGVLSDELLLELRLALNIVAITLLLIVRRLPKYDFLYSPPDGTTSAAESFIDSDPVAYYSEVQSHKRRLTSKPKPRQPSSEIGSSILGNVMFTWVDDLIALGKQRQPQLDDLQEPPQRYLITSAWARFKATRQHSSNSLFKQLAFTFKRELLIQIIVNPVCVALEYAQPFLMQLFLRFIASYTKDPSIGLQYGYFLAFCMLVASLATCVVQQQQDWACRMLYMYIRNVLVAMLARKSMRCKIKSSSVTSGPGQKSSAEGRMYNVLTTDLLRVVKLVKLIRGVLMAPFYLILGAFYMQRLLGMAGVLGILMLVVVVYLTRMLSTRAKHIESQLSKLSDHRLAVISEVIRGIASVKLMGWKMRFVEIIGKHRADQLSVMWKRTKLAALINLCTIGSLPFVMFATFAAYSLQHKLDAEIIFTAIAVFKIIQRTVDTLPELVADSSTFHVSFRRIEKYLAQQEIQPLEDRVDTNDNSGRLGFNHATCMWSVDSEFKLDNLNVNFPSGKLSLISGPTGSGKSSLLSALLGDMELVEGKVCVPTCMEAGDPLNSFNDCAVLSDIAYVSQESWLRSDTIRNNILLGEPFQAQRYERVLRMCALEPDLALFKYRDLTEIGERGVMLSGGQKQRVALARAIYSSRKIVLIDDCLSAVDAETGKHILHKCLLANNELMDGRTCVLVTHHMSLCLPHADFVVTMQNGRINFQGTPDEALSNPDSPLYGLDCLDNVSEYFASENDYDSSENEYEDDSNATNAFTASTAANNQLIQEEERIVGYIRLDTLKMYFDACGGQWFAAMCVIYVVVMQFLSMYKNYYLAAKMDSPHSLYEASTIELRWLVVYLSFGVMSAVVASIGLLVTYIGSQRASAVLHESLVESILSAKLRWFETNPIGRSISRFSSDMQVIDDMIIPRLTSIVRPLVALLISLVVISSTVPMFAAVRMSVLIVYAHYTMQYMYIQRETKSLDSIAYAPVISLISEMMTGSTIIRSFALEAAFMSEVKKYFSIYFNAEFAMRSASRWMRIRVGIVGSVVSFATTLFILANISDISSGLAGFILLQTVGFLQDTIVVVRKYSDLEVVLASVERVQQYLEIEHEAPSLEVTDRMLPIGWPNTGNLAVYNLHAGYTSNVSILHGLNFKVQHGEKIGVVGRTGAGKSSLSLALLRLIEASSGQIELDGINIATIGLETLRKNISIIPQDPVLFNGTIRFNLDPFGDYPDELLKDVLHRTLLLRGSGYSGSSVAAFSSLDDMVMSQGKNLSLGQRQLVALARAMIRRAHLVVLDEATAAVDFENDSRIQKAIRGPDFANSTLFCIAHRLRTIIDYDRILVLDEGNIVEFDTPATLIEQEGGYFRELCENSNEFGLLKKLAISRQAS